MNAPRLHPHTIEAVKQRMDLVEIISESVVLRKRGQNYQGLCPFHEEKTPSFTVNPHRQLYHCFGCGASGNSFQFLMELGQQSFTEVVLDLAQRYQVPIQTLNPQQTAELERQLSVKEQLYEILAVATRFYQHHLRQADGKIALNYLKETRKLNEETIQAFQLGYALKSWDKLYHYLVEVKRYSVELVEQAGLIKNRSSSQGYYDYFRHRLMIPIRDRQGRVIGFGGRTLTQEEPKYLNSPETILFNKGQTLFALDRAHQSIRQLEQGIVVEGYFDAISLHSVGIKNVVAVLGTAVRESQIKQLSRYTESKQIILNLDQDQAGIKATQRTIQEIEPLIYSGQIHLRILNLPEGKDADELIHYSSRESYLNLIKNAPFWLDWQLQQLLINQDLKQADQFQQVAQKMLSILNPIQNLNQRLYYLRYAAELLAQGDGKLISIYTELLLKQLKKPQLRSELHPNQYLHPSLDASHDVLEQAEFLLLLIFLHCPPYRHQILTTLEEKDLLFTVSHHRYLWRQSLQLYLNLSDDLERLESENILLIQLQEELIQCPELMQKGNAFFHLNEIHRRDLQQASSLIESAIATMAERTWQKYYDHCLQQWERLLDQPQPNLSRLQYYQQELQIAQEQMNQCRGQRITCDNDTFHK